MPLWLQLAIIFIVSISGIAFHIILIKKIRAWATKDLIQALAAGNDAKKTHLEQVHQQLLTERTPHKHHQDRLEKAADSFNKTNAPNETPGLSKPKN